MTIAGMSEHTESIIKSEFVLFFKLKHFNVIALTKTLPHDVISVVIVNILT